MSQSNPVVARPTMTQYTADVISAATASFFVSPIITAVDKALVENASGRRALFPSFFATLQECVKSPVQFIKSPAFKWIWFIYGATYASANSMRTYCARNDHDPTMPIWLASSVVNTTTCILKDRAFARAFGTGPPRAVPPASLAIWTLRDALSMAFFITIPPIAGKYAGQWLGDERTGKYAAQLIVPLAFCFVLTPIHLWGYEKYNHPEHNAREVIEFLKKDYLKNVSLKMVRTLPPWVFGSLINTELRSYFCDVLSEKKMDI